MKGAGGTQGGVGQFFLGLLMAVGGAYLLTSQVSVSSGFWAWFGPHTLGLTLVPLVFASPSFFDGSSRAGWLFISAGAAIILPGTLMNLRICFEQTSLFNTVLRFVDNVQQPLPASSGLPSDPCLSDRLVLLPLHRLQFPGNSRYRAMLVHRPARAGPAETRTRIDDDERPWNREQARRPCHACPARGRTRAGWRDQLKPYA